MRRLMREWRRRVLPAALLWFSLIWAVVLPAAWYSPYGRNLLDFWRMPG